MHLYGLFSALLFTNLLFKRGKVAGHQHLTVNQLVGPIYNLYVFCVKTGVSIL